MLADVMPHAVTSRLGDLAAAMPAGIVGEIVGDPDTELRDVTHDSRGVAAGSLFVCVVGATADGHDFADAAVASGAAALVVDRRLPIAVPQLVVDDTRRALGLLASAFHGAPSSSMTVIGITGTNGKTTTAHLVAAALSGAGRTVGVLGTLSGARTTPEASDLQRRLAELRDDGIDTVVMEVSSHALALQRVNGTRFDVAVFTNLGRDHLDLHLSMEEYFRAKARLFEPDLSDAGVVNGDDQHGRLLLDVGAIPMRSFTLADATDVRATPAEHRFGWRGAEVVVPIGGDINLPNSLAALTVCDLLGVDLDDAIAGLAGTPPVPGRFEMVGADLGLGFSVVVDYAHTPDGLAALLGAARRVASGGRVIAVFGCGGDRDRDKRAQMGAAAADGADRVIVTSDNPRTESPAAIIDDVMAGIADDTRSDVAVEQDRRAAIAAALGEARNGDVVVIAGKGHETTQTIGASVLAFDDRSVARELLAGIAAETSTGNERTNIT